MVGGWGLTCPIRVHLGIEKGCTGYSWLEDYTWNHWSGAQTPVVLESFSVVGGLGSHMSNQGTSWRRYSGRYGQLRLIKHVFEH
jgi:hypothetical protein